MKKIPRAEISTIKGMLYPEKKSSLKEWNKKNLKNIKELEEKNKKLKEEKKNFVLPEPYKIERYKNIPSRLKVDTTNWITNEQNKNFLLPRTANYGQKRNHSKPKSVQRNTKTRENNSQSSPVKNEINETGEENIYNILNHKTITMFDKYYANKLKSKNNSINTEKNNLYNKTNSYNSEINNLESQNHNENDLIVDEQLKAKDAAIEQLIKEYKEKYGTDEALENMINEYYGKNKIKEINTNNNNQLSNNLTNTNNNYHNNNNNDNKLVLPKIQKNYIRENRQLVIDNTIPLKHKINEEPIVNNNKHKDYGKVPNYIKKYELEREIKKEEIKRQEEAAKYPKGTKLLSEEERLSTLNGLIENKKEITNQLEKMPITTRTNSIRIRKEELYKKLEEIEKAIDMFSRKQVFVKI